MIPKRIKYAFKVLMNPVFYERALLNQIEIDKLRSKFLQVYKDHLTFAGDSLYTKHSADFINDAKFIESYELGKKTCEGTVNFECDLRWRVHLVCWAATHAAKLEGDFVECGVFTGVFPRSIINYTDFNSLNKTYYLLDTFEGLSEKYSTEKEMEGSNVSYSGHANLFEEVTDTFKSFNTKIIKGTVPETLVEVDSQKIAYLSIDMNCVEPEVAALNYFWDKMVSGGIIVLDDFGYMNVSKEQQKAHLAFAKSKGVEILYFPTCQGLIIKP